jgi:hypothetical protein
MNGYDVMVIKCARRTHAIKGRCPPMACHLPEEVFLVEKF